MDLVEKFHLNLESFFYSDEVASCSKDTSCADVISLMKTKNIGSVVILENKEPIGIFTERDVLKKVALTDIDLKATKISELMTPNPVCITKKTSFSKIMGAMRLGRFRHLIVTDENRKCIGIISIKDIVNIIVDLISDQKK